MAAALGIGPRLRLGQSARMTQQLGQAIGLLQLSGLELRARIARELEANPLLEEAADGGGNESAEPRREREDDPVLRDEPVAEPADSFETAADAGAVWRLPGRGGGGFDGIEAALPAPETLRGSLKAQIGADIADPLERAIGLCLVEWVDDAGRFAGDIEHVAAQLGCPPERARRALARLQACEPAGVGARDLRECLALQLAARGALDPPMERLLDNLDLIAKRDLTALAARCGIGEDEAIARVAAIRALNPKPGAAFDAAPAPVIEPDIVARPRPRGGWDVALNADALPPPLAVRRYRAAGGNGAWTTADRAWLRERRQAADWLLRALDRRARTILRVAGALVRLQEPFLENGVRHLRPLTLREVADAVSMHESTVGRVARDKYMATPRGVFELRYFFSAAIPAAAGGEGHAAEAVRQRIRELVDAEPASRVLSDSGLAAALRESGIDIARRTIAKYRESLNIPPSTQRRRIKSARI